MAKKSQSKNMKKRGLSTIIITLLLILLSLVSIGVIWIFVSNVVNKQISQSQSCFGNFEKVQINEEYTCYEQINSTQYNLRVSLSIGDVNVDSVIVSVSSGSAVNGFEITNSPQSIEDVLMYPSGDIYAVLPGQNSGLTYNVTGFSDRIDSVRISPMIGGNSCGVSDSITELSNCDLM